MEKVRQLARDGKIAVVKMNACRRIMKVPVEMINPFGIECGSPADETVDRIALLTGAPQIRAVLAVMPVINAFFIMNRFLSLQDAFYNESKVLIAYNNLVPGYEFFLSLLDGCRRFKTDVGHEIITSA